MVQTIGLRDETGQLTHRRWSISDRGVCSTPLGRQDSRVRALAKIDDRSDCTVMRNWRALLLMLAIEHLFADNHCAASQRMIALETERVTPNLPERFDLLAVSRTGRSGRCPLWSRPSIGQDLATLARRQCGGQQLLAAWRTPSTTFPILVVQWYVRAMSSGSFFFCHGWRNRSVMFSHESARH